MALGGVRYQIAVSEMISSVFFFRLPYQRGSVRLFQRAPGSRVWSLGGPFCRARLCGSRGGAKRLASSLLMRVARQPIRKLVGSETAVGDEDDPALPAQDLEHALPVCELLVTAPLLDGVAWGQDGQKG